MKILVVDRDDLTVQLIRARLEAQGHEVAAEPAKTGAAQRLKEAAYDIVFLDPSPLTDARPTILSMHRASSHYPYVFLMTEGGGLEEALKAGANNSFPKPFDPQRLEDQIKNAETLIGLIKRIGDGSEDFPSAGGVIAKSAFNQLFLSALDRADRYGERSYVMFISLSNYKEIKTLDGPYAADYAAASLSRSLVRLRRQSDIIGQTAKYEYALLLQRPVYETEPMDAAARFADSLAKIEDMAITGAGPAEITVSLIALPTGETAVKHVLTLEKSL